MGQQNLLVNASIRSGSSVVGLNHSARVKDEISIKFRAPVAFPVYSGTRVSRARCHKKSWFIACSGCRPTFFLIQKNWCKPRLYG